MGASLGTDHSGSVNVELNVVPFIDLMSCLTAFLLVTAVWSSYAQIEIKPKGLNQDEMKDQIEADPVAISVLLTDSAIWVGMTLASPVQIPNETGSYDWVGLQELLDEYAAIPDVQSRLNPGEIEIAAEDDVVYQNVITAMDYAIEANFRDIGYVEPASLTVRFRE
jgi:biopolymer transport protein ExbD